MYLGGKPVQIGNKELPKPRGIEKHISLQIQLLTTFTSPPSHDIQPYSKYTFRSVLWALFDVLIWLKKFVDKYDQPT